MKYKGFSAGETIAGGLLFVNLTAIGYSSYRLEAGSPIFHSLVISFLLLGFLFFYTALRYRRNTLNRLRRIEKENKHLQDYIDASWSSNRKILHEEKILAVRFMMMGISHEIGTPLGNALTSVGVLESLLKNHRIDDSDLEAALALCNKSIERTIDLFNKFKDVAQISLKEDRHGFSLAGVLDNLCRVKDHEWKSRNVRIESDCGEEMSIDSYPYSLSIVLGVLLDNACEAYREEPGVIRIECLRRHKDLEIRIVDQGIGIKKENLENVFAPFFTTSRSENHIGLGLPIAHNLVVNLFQGDLKIESEWEKGTVLTISLPGVFSPVKVCL